LLDGRVLGAALGELGERREESFDSGTGHLSKLSGEDSFPSAGANRCREDDLDTSVNQAARQALRIGSWR
jgi:hypothetical protein